MPTIRGTSRARRVAALVGWVALLAPLASAVLACKNEQARPAPQRPPAEAAAEPKTPVRGGHVRLPSNQPTFLNPVLETGFDVASGLIFEGMVGLDARLEPVPRLAESWTVSPDAKTITFKLRKNVVFQDGQKLTSKDVAFTFDAIRKTAAETLWKPYMAPVTKIETPDELTVVVHYDEPYAPALVTWTVGIIPEHVYGGGPVIDSPGNREPVGTGPFKMVRWEVGKRMILEANDKWWYGRPHLDTIELVLNVSTGEAVDQLRRGQLDWAPVQDADDWINVAQLPEFRQEFEVSDTLEPQLQLIAWNNQRAPFDDVRTRRALTYALDRSRVIDDVLLGQARSLSAPLFPNMFGANPSIAPLPHDPAKAKELLDAITPVKNGKRFAVEIIASELQRSPVTDAMFAIFRRDLENLGIDVKVSMLPWQDYRARLSKRDYDAAYLGWVPDIPDPDPSALLHSSLAQVGTNYAAYRNPEVDALLESARKAPSRDERKALYAKLHAILAEELPYTPVYAPVGHYAWTRRLRGVGGRDIAAQPVFPGVARWWVEQRPAPSKR